MLEILLTSLYALLSLAIIYQYSFFQLEGISKKIIAASFILKIIFGLALWWIYTYHYPDRSKADIYKYYDDSKPLYDLLFKDPISFLQILFGINNGPDNFHYIYEQMYNWYSPFATHIYNSNQAIIRINAVLRIFAFGCFNVHTVFFCFFSFIGQVAIYKTFYPYLSDKKWALFAAVFLMPTVLFWGSGVLKEAIILFGLGIFVYSIHAIIIYKKINLKLLLLLVFAVITIAIMKLYILISLFPGVVFICIAKCFDYKFLILKYISILALMVSMGYGIGKISDNFNAAAMLSFRQKDFYNTMRGGIYFQRFVNNSTQYDNIYFPAAKLSKFKNVEREDTIKINFTDTAYVWDVMTYNFIDTILVSPSENIKYRLVMKDTISGSGIHIPPLDPTYLSIIKNAPIAFVNTLARPHPFEIDSLFSFMAAIENILIEIFIIFCFFFIQKPTNEKRTIALFCFSFVLMLFILTGLVTPVIGAIVRYKMPALPFLVIALLLIVDGNKVRSFCNKFI